MMDTGKTSIEKLNSSNYQIWKYKIELELNKEQVWDVVNEDLQENPSEAWKRKDEKARASIGLLLEDSEFIHVKKAKTVTRSYIFAKDICSTIIN